LGYYFPGFIILLAYNIGNLAGVGFLIYFIG